MDAMSGKVVQHVLVAHCCQQDRHLSTQNRTDCCTLYRHDLLPFERGKLEWTGIPIKQFHTFSKFNRGNVSSASPTTVIPFVDKSSFLKLQNGSDIRGVAVDGVEGEPISLTEPVTQAIAAAFALWLLEKKKPDVSKRLRVSIGHDSRISAQKLQVLRSKYGNGRSNLFLEGRDDPASFESSWWKDLKNNTFFDSSNWFRGGLRKKIGNGLLTKFWRDIWIDDITLAERFPRLSLVARDREILVGNMGFWEEGSWVWRWNWRRDLFDWEQSAFNDLVLCLNRVTLSQNQEDFWIWNEDNSNRYSVHSAYNIFREEEMIEGDTKEAFSMIWDTYCPSKVAAFSWRAIRDRISTKQNLVRRQIISADIMDLCTLCRSEEESLSHLLFYCSVSYKIWMKCYAWLGFSSALNGSFVGHLLQHKGLWTHSTGIKGWMTIWESVIWSIWLLRNNLCFKGSEIHIDDVVESIMFRSWSWIRHRHGKGNSFSYSCDDWKKEPSLCLRAL